MSRNFLCSRFGPASLGMAWRSLVWLGAARFGKARFCVRCFEVIENGKRNKI